MILLIVSPEARTSRHVREALEVGRMYRRPVCAVWIEGENWQECLPADEQELSVRIDARMSDDPGLFEEIVTLLQQGWTEPETTTASAPGVVRSQRNRYRPASHATHIRDSRRSARKISTISLDGMRSLTNSPVP